MAAAEALALTDIVRACIAPLSHTEWARVAGVSCAFRHAVDELRAACLVADEADLGVSVIGGADERSSGACDEAEAQARAAALSDQPYAALSTQTVSLPTLLPALQQLPSLQVLKLRHLRICDTPLEAVGGLPQLRRLELTGCQRITNRGIRALASSGCARLEEVDLTFCELVGYTAVLALRRACPRLTLIRRQPAWMDGAVSTPWGETHTYYADGAFEFTRREEAMGWVAQCRDRGGFVEDRLVYTDLEHTWSHNGRIGVLLKPLPDRRLLVVQSTCMPEPPLSFPELPESLMPSVGCSCRLGGVGEGLMISCMRLEPLPADRLMPPPTLVAALERFCQQHPQRRMAHERRALVSIHDTRRGRARLTSTIASLVATLNVETPPVPAALPHFEANAEMATIMLAGDDESSSDSDNDSTIGGMGGLVSLDAEE